MYDMVSEPRDIEIVVVNDGWCHCDTRDPLICSRKRQTYPPDLSARLICFLVFSVQVTGFRDEDMML